jgi:hypothetical protein
MIRHGDPKMRILQNLASGLIAVAGVALVAEVLIF